MGCGTPDTGWGGAETGRGAAGTGWYSTPSARNSFSGAGPASAAYATQGAAAEKSAYVIGFVGRLGERVRDLGERLPPTGGGGNRRVQDGHAHEPALLVDGGPGLAHW